MQPDARTTTPRPDDPYRDCEAYLEHGACVCSTGYPANCTAQEIAPLTLEDVRTELHKRGYRWHYFGEGKNLAGSQSNRYWFNGSTMGEGAGRLSKQPFGWFTLDEMLAEKFAEGCR